MNNNLTPCVPKSPLSIRVYTWVLVIAFFIFIVLLFQGRYGKQEMAKGVIREGAYYRILPNKPGNVLDIYVKEGDVVNEGDKLFRMSLLWQDVENNNDKSVSEEESIRLHQLEDMLLEEKVSLNRELMDINIRKIRYREHYQATIKNIDSVYADYLKKREMYKVQISEIGKLVKERSISKSELEAIKQHNLDNELAIKKINIEKNNLDKEREEQELSFQQLALQLTQNRSQLEQRLNGVKQEKNNILLKKHYIVTAPVSATVHDIGIITGDFIQGDAPSIILKGDNESEPFGMLFLTTQQIGLLERDEKHFLRVDTFPYEDYGTLSAEVVNISDTPLKVSLDHEESLFRVKLRISEEYGRIPLNSLKDGMTFNTSLRQPEKTLLEWLFMPVVKTFKRNPDILNNEIDKG